MEIFKRKSKKVVVPKKVDNRHIVDVRWHKILRTFFVLLSLLVALNIGLFVYLTKEFDSKAEPTNLNLNIEINTEKLGKAVQFIQNEKEDLDNILVNPSFFADPSQ